MTGGPVAEWFSTLLMGQKVWGSNPDRGENPCDWKTLSVHPAVSGYLIQFREGSKAAKGEGWAPSSIMLCPGHGDSKQVTAATAYKAMRSLTFLT